MKGYRTVFILLGIILIILIILSVFLTQQLIRAKQEHESQTTATTVPTTTSSDMTQISHSSLEPTTMASTTTTTMTTTTSSIEPTQTSTQISSCFITAQQAEQIALDQVGANAKIIKIENDLGDNPPKYEISLQDGRYRYELEIHAITGAVIDLEKEALK